jgi:hypothetical protein
MNAMVRLENIGFDSFENHSNRRDDKRAKICSGKRGKNKSIRQAP